MILISRKKMLPDWWELCGMSCTPIMAESLAATVFLIGWPRAGHAGQHHPGKQATKHQRRQVGTTFASTA